MGGLGGPCLVPQRLCRHRSQRELPAACLCPASISLVSLPAHPVGTASWGWPRSRGAQGSLGVRRGGFALRSSLGGCCGWGWGRRGSWASPGVLGRGGWGQLWLGVPVLFQRCGHPVRGLLEEPCPPRCGEALHPPPHPFLLYFFFFYCRTVSFIYNSPPTHPFQLLLPGCARWQRYE